MFLLPFVLPALAIGYLCWFIHRPLLGLFGFSQLEQTTRNYANSIAQLASERGQEDEYETLLALGFIPLGVYRESDNVFGENKDQYVLTHRELPVTCSLCENANQELYIVLTTDDSDGRLVRTSSSAATIEFDSDNGFAQTVEAETLEKVFVAHVRALNKWEQRGFQPVRIDTLEDVKAHYLRHYQNPELQGLLRFLYGGFVAASVFASVGFPWLVSLFAPRLADLYQVNLSSVVLTQIYAAISLAATHWLHRAQMNLSKVPVKNSLRPRDRPSNITA